MRAKEKLEVIDRIVSRLITNLEIDRANLIRIREIIKEGGKSGKKKSNTTCTTNQKSYQKKRN